MLRRLCSAALAAVLVAAACSSDGESVAVAVPAGDASAFCLGWPEARAALQTELGDTNREWETRGNVEVARLVLDEADARVPAALRTDWTSATKYQDTVITLLEIVDFTPERLPVQLIDAAFGEGGVEAAAAVSEISIERIDAWALDECGDFCELWPRLERALGWVGSGAGDTHEDFRLEGPRDEAMIMSADPLVPAAVRDAWDEASALKLRLVEFFTSLTEDGTEDNQERYEQQMDTLGMGQFVDQGFDALVEEFGEPPPDVDWGWWFAGLAHDENLGVIGAWVADNCESVGVLGLPGVVRVEDPGRSLDTLLIAAVPVGTDLGEIQDASDFLAVACSEQRQGEVWSSSLLERNSGFDQPCIHQHREDLGARAAMLAAGEYDLFIGSFPRGVGNFNTYVPAPELCAVIPLTVDGDTDVTVPDLEPCDLGPLAGTAEEIARRQPPPDTGGPTGTLRVTLTEHVLVDGVAIDYRLAVLPAGTTLNQIALGDAWPVGTACLSMNQPLDRLLEDMTPPESEDRSAEFEEWDRQAEREAEQRQTVRQEVERQLAELQAQFQELERQEAGLGELPEAERAEGERQIADERLQLGEMERQIADQLNQLEDGDRQAEQQALQRQAERRQTEETQEEILRQVTPLLEAIDGGGIQVPVLPFPAAPTGDEGCLGVHELLGIHDSSWREPPLAVLPAGDYDVYVHVDLWNEEMGVESQNQCVTLTASVAGETLVKAPPLEDCP